MKSSVCRAVALVFLGGAILTAAPADDREATPAALLRDPVVKLAIASARAAAGQSIEDQIRFCEVPAPSFKETARGEVLRQAFQQLGLANVRVDKVGNVLGDRPGAGPRPRVVLSAHLDTVFPENTDVKVRRSGAVLHGPGIGDDCRGLALMVAVARALRQANLQTPGSITFVATVGEEGLGDLRGVKHLFGTTLAGEIDRFVSIDGTGLGVTNVGVASRRYRVTFAGPGGHSFAAFGLPSPIGAMGRAIVKISEFRPPTAPKTTFNVGRVGGGTSVNSIAGEAWMEVDLRSADGGSLAALEMRFQKAVEAAVAEENGRWRAPGVITATRERVGDRPGGATPATSAIVRTVEAVHQVLGMPMTLSESSTDANVPMNLHIPAITIGAGGRGASTHSLAESYDTTDAWLGTERALLLTIALAR